MKLARSPAIFSEFPEAAAYFKVPEDTLGTTWMADVIPSKDDRVQAMQKQMGGGWELPLEDPGDLITKERFLELHKRMTILDDGDGYDKKRVWGDSLDKLKALGNSDIGAMLTLSAFTHPETGKEMIAIICSAAPAGSMDGTALVLGPAPSGASDTLGDGTMEPSSAMRLLLPIGETAPSDINPVVAMISRGTRELLPASPSAAETLHANAFRDAIVFLKGQKLTQPYCLLVTTAEMPPRESEEYDLFGGPGTDYSPPKFHGDIQSCSAWATLDNELEPDECNYFIASRAIYLPRGTHGIPLGVPIDPKQCRDGATLAEICEDLTGMPSNVYAWMIDNPCLDLLLRAMAQDPRQMKIETHFMHEIAESWANWKAEDSMDSQATVTHIESLFRYRLLLDQALATTDRPMRKKLMTWLTKAMTVLENSPELTGISKDNLFDNNYLPFLIEPKTKDWTKRFHWTEMKKDVPEVISNYASIVLAADKRPAPSIVLKTTITSTNSPAETPPPKQRRSAADVLAALHADMRVTAKTPERAKTASELKKARESQLHVKRSIRFGNATEAPQELVKNQASTEFDSDEDTAEEEDEQDDSVVVIEQQTKKQRIGGTPPRAESYSRRTATRKNTFKPTGLCLPYEQAHPQLQSVFREGMELIQQHPPLEFLIPTAGKSQDRFNREQFIEEELESSATILAHFGAYAFPPKIRIGPLKEGEDSKIFPDFEMVLPGIVSKRYSVHVLETKDSAVLAVFFDTEIRAATTSQSLNVLRPSFKSTDFYQQVDQVKALQSGVLVCGETFSTTAAVVAGGISPLHFIITINSSAQSYRLPSNGWECRHVSTWLRNQVFWFGLMFRNPQRYPHLKSINDEVFPALLTGPLIGQYTWCLELFSDQRLQEVWDQLQSDKRLQVTAAFTMAIVQLWKLFLDWANPNDFESHCLTALLHSTVERSDLSVLNTTDIRLRDHSSLANELLSWRMAVSSCFNSTVLTAKCLPVTDFYNVTVPPGILPTGTKSEKGAATRGDSKTGSTLR